ncbi:MFS transporter [Saccharopolyspora sp. ASAGF58]|uniref:MFS transporter n=1 Tax=Saccharopolyspora sp. ASAGF58 TaxID=2719023 RepID=UPI00143FCCF7|nr:MFS transporter [Saccharopolyspora sp. ASAGF58]QIZ35793.1 MFS transporter [Saccharopolyspora sp. ASAGF58]
MVGRALQGACGAKISLGILKLRDILPTKQFGRYLGILTAVNSGATGVDTLLGGVITDTTGFRGIFGFTFVLEVITALSPGLGAHGHPNGLDGRGGDLPGPAGPERLADARPDGGIVHPGALACLAASLVLLVVFCTMALIFAVLTFVYPTLAQNATAGFGYDGTTTALMFLMPYALAGWILAPLAGWLAPKIGYRNMLRIGLVGWILALIAATVFVVNFTWLLFILVALMAVSCAACAATALNGMGVIYAPAKSPGLLPGLNATMFNLGASVGIGVLAGLVSQGTPEGARATQRASPRPW